MTLSSQIATTGLTALATATGPGVTWRERLGSAAATVSLPLATTGYEASGTLGGVSDVFTLDVAAGSGSVSGAGTAATATITYGSPTNGNTVTVNGTVLTKAAAAGAAAFSTIVELEALIEALPGINSSQNGTVVSITAASTGTAGNAVTLAKTGAALTLSGATLTGGVNASTLVGADGKDIEGVTLTTLVKVMGMRIECTAGGLSVDNGDTLVGVEVGSTGVFMVLTPAGITSLLPPPLLIIALAADSAFKVTVLGSIV